MPDLKTSLNEVKAALATLPAPDLNVFRTALKDAIKNVKGAARDIRNTANS